MGRINLTNRIKHGVMMLFVVLGMVFVAPVAADEGGEGVREIRPPAGFDAGEVDISSAVKKHFDLTGKVNYKTDDRVVISDGNFKIAEDAKISSVSQGAYVGVKLNDRGEIVELKRLQSPR
ncbi:MAG: hypothetical protein U5L07_16130 [Desulfobacterales bacterium]|nr:hypothetical protein [Desulfobacterales bacterium]